MKKKIKLIEVIETLTFLAFILTLGWLLWDGIKAIFNNPFSFDSVTAYGYVVLLALIVFVLPPVWAIIKSKKGKK
jgi:hypothetical protein